VGVEHRSLPLIWPLAYKQHPVGYCHLNKLRSKKAKKSGSKEVPRTSHQFAFPCCHNRELTRAGDAGV